MHTSSMYLVSALPIFVLSHQALKHTRRVAVPTTRSSSFSLVTEGTGSAVDPKLFEVDYGSGSVLGMEGLDNVSLAGLDLSHVLFGLVLYEDQQACTYVSYSVVPPVLTVLTFVGTRPCLLRVGASAVLCVYVCLVTIVGGV